MNRRFPRQRKSLWAVVAIILIMVAMRLLEQPSLDLGREPVAAEVQVLRVVDGDTLLVEGNQRVRMLGIDTPETKHPTLPPEPFGAEATEFTEHVVTGHTIRLEFDIERYDDYGRILAFVFVDGMMLNEQLVAAGLATAEPQYSFRSDYKKRLIAAEKNAKAQHLGIWSTK